MLSLKSASSHSLFSVSFALYTNRTLHKDLLRCRRPRQCRSFRSHVEIPELKLDIIHSDRMPYGKARSDDYSPIYNTAFSYSLHKVPIQQTSLLNDKTPTLVQKKAESKAPPGTIAERDQGSATEILQMQREEKGNQRELTNYQGSLLAKCSS